MTAGLLLLTVAATAFAATPAGWAMLPGRVGAPDTVMPVELRSRQDQPELRLAILGDVGTGDANEWSVAELVTRHGALDPFDGLILLGDNAYENGDPDRLQATVFDPFGDVLAAGAKLLPVLGNHDVRDGNAAGQVGTLGMPGRWYAEALGPVLFVGLDSTLVDDPAQTRWLETTLATAEAEWIIVGMHHPAFSAGFHGSEEAVQEAWVPIFERHGADIVLAGHDHDYQRSQLIGGVTYVVSGGGAKVRPTGRAEFTAFSASVLHFVELGIWRDRIELRAISDGGVFDGVTIVPNDGGAMVDGRRSLQAMEFEGEGGPPNVAMLVAAVAGVAWLGAAVVSRSRFAPYGSSRSAAIAYGRRLALAVLAGSALAASLLAFV